MYLLADTAAEKSAGADLTAGGIEPGLVSVIVPTLNRARLVTELVEALFAQTWRPVEIIVVDDGSSDDTLARLTTMTPPDADCSITILRQENAGPAAARNHGLRQARGEFVYFVDSDDLVFPLALETLVRPLRSSDAPFALAEIRNADEAGALLPDDGAGRPRLREGDVFASHWMTHNALYRRSAIDAAGGFNETLRCGEDNEFQWRVMTVSGRPHVTTTLIGVRRLHGYGHLSVGRPIEERSRWTVDAFTAFQAWALSRGDQAAIPRRFRWRLLACGIRLGSVADWIGKDRAFAAIAGFPARGLDPAWMVWLGRHRNRALFAMLRAGGEALKAARDALAGRPAGSTVEAEARRDAGQPGGGTHPI
ncbi:MAG TPA: glycosyltransferase family A protein [Caulobacter sp.]|nr:glycosyltransferase family A protein [Caulobacter sp.]